MKQNNIDKKERSVAENIIVVVLIGALMASFIHYFLKQDQQLSHTGLTSMASSFAMKVLTIRAQWFMDGKPEEVMVTVLNSELSTELRSELDSEYSEEQHYYIPVNKRGWLDVEEGNLCQQIWQYAMGAPLILMKEPIVAIEIKNNKVNIATKQLLSVCRYQLASGWYFDYYRENGKVSAVTKM